MRGPSASFISLLGGAALLALLGSAGTAGASCASNPTCNPYEPTTGACCDAATCEWLATNASCEDRNDCTSNTLCNNSHECVKNAAFSGATTCRDRGPGGVPKNCKSGTCNGTMTCTLGTDPCDDSNPCTNDCQDTTNIACYSSPHPYKATGSTCEADGNACTLETCDAAHACSHSGDIVCPNSNPPDCRLDQCQTTNGSCARVDAPADTPCTADNNQCTLDRCNDQGGCQHPANTGASCSDTNECTEADTCNASKNCVGTAKTPGTPCTDDGNTCSFDYCTGVTAGTAACTHSYINSITGGNTQGNSCNDGHSCSSNTTCDQQACAGAGSFCDSSVACLACQSQCSTTGFPACGCPQ